MMAEDQSHDGFTGSGTPVNSQRDTYFTTTMQLFNWIPYFILAIVLPVLANEAPKDLVIETVYKPDDCKTTAMSGDSLAVHYVCPLPS
jgi:hypothetical protein